MACYSGPLRFPGIMMILALASHYTIIRLSVVECFLCACSSLLLFRGRVVHVRSHTRQQNNMKTASTIVDKTSTSAYTSAKWGGSFLNSGKLISPIRRRATGQPWKGQWGSPLNQASDPGQRRQRPRFCPGPSKGRGISSTAAEIC